MENEAIRRLLIAYDFSPCADRAMEMGLAVARQFHAEALAINIINSRDIEAIEHAVHRSLIARGGDETVDLVREFEEERMDRLKESIQKHATAGVRIKPMVFVGEPVQEILRCAEKHRADLIVMGARGHSRMERLITGSKAETLFRLSTIPVLSVRQDKNG